MINDSYCLIYTFKTLSLKSDYVHNLVSILYSFVRRMTAKATIAFITNL